MKVKIFLKPKNGSCYAEAFTDGKNVSVLPGGHIRKDFANHIRGGKNALRYREDNEFVDSEGTILKQCDFTSPSTAAQFITGRSTNGYEAWKVEEKKSLGDYLKEKGLK